MTDEVKVQVDDMKDFAQQAKLEIKKKGRDAKLDAAEKFVDLTGHHITAHEGLQGAQMVARDKLHNAVDLSKQVGLEAKIRSRDAKLAFDKSDTGKALEKNLDVASQKFESAKDSVLDAVQPATKTVEATSTRGVDITHVENTANDRVESHRRDALIREQKSAEAEREAQRQLMLDSAKAKANAAGEVIKDKTAGITSVLGDLKDRAEVALGEAVLATKEKLDDAVVEPAAPVYTSKVNEKGIDLSSGSNPRNEELAARDELATKLAVARASADPNNKEASFSDKVAAVGDKIKNAFTEATTESPQPLYVPKRSEAGIDVSHCENASNAELARQEEARLHAARSHAMAQEKELLKGAVVEPAAESLSAKFEALGNSLLGAATVAGESIRAKYEELANPLPLDVHEKRSENGIDTSSIANANNNAIGERVKAQSTLLGATGLAAEPKLVPGAFSSASAASAVAAASAPAPTARTAIPPRDAETAVIQAGLDTGVVARDAGLEAKQVGSAVKSEARQVKREVKADVATLQADIKQAAIATKEKVEAVSSDLLSTITAAPTAM